MRLSNGRNTFTVSEPVLTVVVVYSAAPRQVFERVVSLAPPCTVSMALVQGGLLACHPDLNLSEMDVGVWGHKATLDGVLHDKDRVEVYRPLRVDPKVARRERFVVQGARTAGLFVKKTTAKTTE